MDTPTSYARAIAYLGDASTIYARTRDEFGRAPAMFVCERIVAERTKERSPAKPIGSREPDEADGNGFAVRGLVPQMAAPKPEHPPMVINLPVRADLDLSIPTELAMAAAKAFGVTVKAMVGHSRDIEVMAARSVYIKLLRDRLRQDGTYRFSLKQIAARVNRSDHTTIRHMLQTYLARAKMYPEIDRVYAELKAMGA